MPPHTLLGQIQGAALLAAGLATLFPSATSARHAFARLAIHGTVAVTRR